VPDLTVRTLTCGEETFLMTAQLAERYFAPHNKKSDANEPTFDGTALYSDGAGGDL
jgi:hypothetical protein